MTAITITVTGIRTTRCTSNRAAWITELETAEGIIVDPFVSAVDVPLHDEPASGSQAETDIARKMVGRRYELERAHYVQGVLVPSGIRELRTDDGQRDLFGGGS